MGRSLQRRAAGLPQAVARLSSPISLLPSCELSFRHRRLFPFVGIWENISLFSFPVAAVTNYHKVGGFQKQHKLIVLAPAVGSLTRVSLHGNQGVGGPVHLLGVPREHLCPGLLQLLEAALILGPWSLLASSEPAVLHFCAFCPGHLSPTPLFHLILPSSKFKDSVITLRPPR